MNFFLPFWEGRPSSNSFSNVLANIEGWTSAGIDVENRKLYDLWDILALKFRHYYPNLQRFGFPIIHTNNIFRHVDQALHGYYRTHLPGLQRTLPVPASLEVLNLPVKRDSFSSGPVKRRTSHVTNSNFERSYILINQSTIYPWLR